MLRLLPAVATLSLLMGCAVFAQPQDAASRSPEEARLINETCAKVMGLRQGEEFYLDCQDSLSHSLQQRDAAYAMAAHEDDCRSRGLKPGSAALATCMLDSGRPTTNAPASQPVAAIPVATMPTAMPDTIQPGRSYYSVRPGVQFERKRYACAQLGLVPNSALFSECVANLEGALQTYSG